MSRSHDSQVNPGRTVLFAAALASALGLAAGAACSSSPLQPGSPGTAGASAGSGGTAGAAGSSCVQTVRAACTQTAATVTQTCQTDADCAGINGFVIAGHCLAFGGQMQCSYDTCVSDDDCGARPATCLCQGQWHVYAGASPGNACRSGNCRDDSDCLGTLCSPSVSFGASFSGYAGYYCHTAQDQCHCDADCASPLPSCAYNPEIAAWACASFGPAG
jgi:hypothetical protein